MIGKVSLGGSFGGSVRYVMEGRHTEEEALVNKRAEILAANGVRPGTIGQMTADFERQQERNPDLGKAVWHTALAFSEQDAARLTNNYLIELARLYMTRLGIEPDRTQWLLVRHRDRAHPHVHLVLNRIQADDKKVDASFCRSRSRAVAVGIAQEQGLTASVGQAVNTRRIRQQVPPSDWKLAKASVYKALSQEVPGSASLADLTARLHKHGIQVARYPATAATDESTQGIVFIHKGQFIKASQADRVFAWPKLKKQLATNQATNQRLSVPAPVQVSKVQTVKSSVDASKQLVNPPLAVQPPPLPTQSGERKQTKLRI